MEGMSMMFSPYGDGPLPPTAMAELEKKLKSNKQTKAFLKMLELDKKPKINQVQSAPVSVPASPPLPPPPPSAKAQDTASLQARRAESASQQQYGQMPSASRRGQVVPSLSLAIPPSPSGQRGVRTQQPRNTNGKGVETTDEKEIETSADSLHKHVKFLAPDEGEMSDQSSICQSPSWEGYGQRKKDKKKEAERKKKEKEQAEKEARATKKRNGARLSKSPPPPLPERKLIVPGLTHADRSMSDPMLISSHLPPNRQAEQHQADFGRTASADNLQQLQHYQPDMAEVLSDFNSNGQPFVGGVKLEREREATMQNQYSFPYSQYSGHADTDSSPQNPHSPPPDGSVPAGYPSSKQDGRQGFPPSASRTPMLRHMPPPPPRERSNNLLQGATKMFKGRDGKTQGDGDLDRGRHRDGYVQDSREQSTERSLAEIAYDQLINNGSIHSSSTRSSSRHTQNTRRSSFSQEAKSVAMKLAGMVTGPSSKEDPMRGNRVSLQRDYFGYMDSKPDTPSAQGNAIFPSRPQDNWRGASAEEPVSPYAAQDRPATSQSSGSSSNPSVAGSISSSHHKKARRPREAAPAPPNIPTGRLPSSNNSGSTMNGHGEFAGPVMSKAITSLRSDYMTKAGASIPRPDSATVPLDGCDTTPRATMAPPAKLVKPKAVDTTVGRASEGSSSSSAYEEGSPVSSPVTTPDTSRPQSSRGVAFTVGEIVKGMSESPGGYDDESTLRQLSDRSSEASASSTPRLLKSEERHGAEEEEEQEGWNGPAPPVDTDDAQSFTTSFSNLDNIDNIDGTLVSASVPSRSPGEVQESKFLNLAESLQKTRPGQRPAELPFRHDSAGKSALDPPITIPPRSKRRGTGSSYSPSSPDPSPREERHAVGPEPEELSDEVMQLCLDSAKNAADTRVANQTESEHLQEEDKGALKREKAKRRQRQVMSRSPDDSLGHDNDRDLPYGESFSPLGLNSSTFIVPDIPRSPYNSNFPGSTRAPSSGSRASSRVGASPPSPDLSRFPRAMSPPQHPPPPSPGFPGANRMGPRPPSSTSTRSSGTNASGSGSRTATAMPPVSILKHSTRTALDPPQPASSAGSRASMLSALPKHMQLQAGVSTRPPTLTPESRMAPPIAKMFVECCGCKFYHDMPSKLYECMAKPDAVVEDRMLGISGAITTMVKCPWCQHNMSTSCCSGYAAVVYLKEKLH